MTVDQLVVITFTEKAAAELATRVRDGLEGGPTRPAARSATGSTAARDLYRAHIETIHSFATALLRERPVEAELDPLFEVLEGLADSLDFDAAYERFQDELLAQPRPELERALRRGLGLRELREACQRLNEHRYLLPLAHPAARRRPQRIAELRAIADELNALLAQHNPPGDDKAIPSIVPIGEWVTELEAQDLLSRERMLIGGCSRRRTRAAERLANWGRRQGTRSRGSRRATGNWSRSQSALRSKRCSACCRTSSIRRGLRARRPQAARHAGFDDLLFWARDLLRTSPPARNYFRGRFRAVLIDEFQDTDPVQAELALLLTSLQEPGGDWRAMTPGPGRLTVVGDPKQSIYRFRRADIAVYELVCDGALAGGFEQISTNFRSNGRCSSRSTPRSTDLQRRARTPAGQRRAPAAAAGAERARGRR